MGAGKGRKPEGGVNWSKYYNSDYWKNQEKKKKEEKNKKKDK